MAHQAHGLQAHLRGDPVARRRARPASHRRLVQHRRAFVADLTVLFEIRFWDGIRDGTVTVTFRRWKRPQAKAGNTNRTPAGIVRVDSVDVVDPAKITNADARRSGFS